ncbi:sugar phosphate isomerase/epimerase family protein [Alicyclobacillus sp. ALC3]|uniref:sugar phosphate isomerase/epimerase family protein n=1 Tax=Alicyclobacillus sp. ALC3 TaxID=2796143 RepID=UPI0023783529|nr:sugar phosphate isomerase/epimerase [Alicyclobacillus sp. ALC3]WDL97903.1 sugar phosphate isomerase/epimerase [Alicyclobacillus sp. ALC3]
MPKIALQLYTLRDEMTDDFAGKLQRVREIGYAGVEFAGYGGLKPAKLATFLSDLQLVAVSNHVPFEELENHLDRAIEGALTVGLQYMVCPSVPAERCQTKDDFARLADLFNEIGTRVAAAGMAFGYHNHDHEFTQFDGEFALDYLFSHTDPVGVQTELDLFWIEKAGQSSVQYIERYRDRCPLLHVKDMTNDEERFYAEVGQGTLPWPEIFQAAEQSGTQWYIVEQDECRRDPFECIQTSFDYLLHHI